MAALLLPSFSEAYTSEPEIPLTSSLPSSLTNYNLKKKTKQLNFCVLCIVEFEALSNGLDLGEVEAVKSFVFEHFNV